MTTNNNLLKDLIKEALDNMSALDNQVFVVTETDFDVESSNVSSRLHCELNNKEKNSFYIGLTGTSPEASYVDQGIGDYEFWGSRYTDSKVEWVVEGDVTFDQEFEIVGLTNQHNIEAVKAELTEQLKDYNSGAHGNDDANVFSFMNRRITEYMVDNQEPPDRDYEEDFRDSED